jgi:SAM-dependent methyltransferase
MTNGGSDGFGAAATWHHGLVARWWALFRHDGPEIAFFRRFVAAGEPALDVGCGTGRLLVPYVRDGLDVDGADASADMIDHCRAAASAVGAAPNLYVQPAHELDIDRSYSTVLMCGTFGVGSIDGQDAAGLERIRAHLAPGGTFVMDYETADHWTPRIAPDTGAPPPGSERQRGPDGDEYALRQRVVAVDDSGRQVRREMHAWRWHDGELVGDERHVLTYVRYRPGEIVDLLGRAGFVDVSVIGGYDGTTPTPQHAFLVYVARTPS